MATSHEEEKHKHIIHIDSRACLKKRVCIKPDLNHSLVDERSDDTDIKVFNATTNNIHISSTTSPSSLASPNTNPINDNISKNVHFAANYTAIANTAATGNYVTPDCPVTNIHPTSTGINVTIPDGSNITSSHTALLRLPPTLPLGARIAHIFPGLKSGSLISIGQLCDHGCTAFFDAKQLRISYNNEIIMTGFRSVDTNNLWLLQLDDHVSGPSASAPSPSQVPNHSTPHIEPTIGTANSIVSNNTLAEQIAFYHATLFSPVISTWCDAIDRNSFTTWPELTSAQVRKYLPEGSIATIKGHLHQQRANLRSTKTTATLEEAEDYSPSPILLPIQRSHAVFANVEPITGKSYSDQTGRFLAPSATGNEYVFVFYDYDSNSIHAVPIKNRTAGEIKRAYVETVELLKSRGLHPKLQILDNEASKILLEYINQEDIDYQLAPPHVHRCNAAECAISTYKDHLIAGLCSTDKNYPLELWDKLIQQSIISLNLLRRSHINPQLSAYAQVIGQFDFNKTPLAPPGTRVLVHEKPTVHGSWDPRAIDAWYIGPAMKHYRCYRVWIRDTRSERVADTLAWFPTKVRMPTASSLDIVLAAANDLIKALWHPSPGSPLAPTTDS
jgi:hypothetical protein